MLATVVAAATDQACLVAVFLLLVEDYRAGRWVEHWLVAMADLVADRVACPVVVPVVYRVAMTVG